MKEMSRSTRGQKMHTIPSQAAKTTSDNPDTNLVERGRITAEERRRMTADAAYFRAQSRGFSGGSPEKDWYEAEAEIDGALLQHSRNALRGGEGPHEVAEGRVERIRRALPRL